MNFKMAHEYKFDIRNYKDEIAPVDQVSQRIREQIHEKLQASLKGKEQPRFKISKRKKFYNAAYRTEYDVFGHCCMCRIEIVYDSKMSSGVPIVCVPCALRLIKDGMREISALGGWTPTHENENDDVLMQRLQLNMRHNEREGQNDPKYAGFKGKPRHQNVRQKPKR